MKGGQEGKTVKEREDEERAAEARERALERARHNEIAADRARQYHQRDRDNSWSFPFPCTILGGRIKNILRKKYKSKRVNKRVNNKRCSRKSFKNK